jgi:chemotaxis protein MotA
VFLPEYALQKKTINPMSEVDLVELRKRANGFYSVFVNLTSIFPLLGIFGTVISLLPMVSQIDSTQQSFFTALTSTFWGLVFAIIFKFLDGFLASRIDVNNNNIMLYLERKRSVPEETPCEAEAS